MRREGDGIVLTQLVTVVTASLLYCPTLCESKGVSSLVDGVPVVCRVGGTPELVLSDSVIVGRGVKVGVEGMEPESGNLSWRNTCD